MPTRCLSFVALLLIATAARAVSVDLAWDPPVGGMPPTGYILERSYDGVNFTAVGSVSAKETSLIDKEPRAPRTCWRASAYVVANFEWYYSGYSNVLCLDFTPPAPPPDTWVTLQGEDSDKAIAIGWTPPALGESFAIYRKFGDNSPYELYSEDGTMASLDVQSPDIYVCRYVVARNTFGDSAPGAEICVTSSREPSNVTVTATGTDKVIYVDIQQKKERKDK